MSYTVLLDYDTFVNEVTKAMQERYTAERVRIHHVTKNNGIELTGISVDIYTEKNDENKVDVWPTLYFEYLYNDYQNGETFGDVISKMIRLYEGDERYDVNAELVKKITDFVAIKGFIFPFLVNTEMNQKMFEDVPSTQFLDLSVVYKVCIDNNSKGMATSTISNNLLETWGITAEELQEVAMSNLMSGQNDYAIPRLSPFLEMMYYIMKEKYHDEEEAAAIELLTEEMEEDQMLLLTNKALVNGAAMLLNTEFMKAVYRKVNKKMFIIPSSIHECILLPFEHFHETEDVNAMIQEVNKEHLQRNEILSNHCYLLTEDGVTMYTE